MPFTHAVPFSIQQLERLAAWGESRPCGLELLITTDDPDFDEVALLSRPGAEQPVYCITAVSTGEVDVVDAGGQSHALRSLDEAIAWVMTQAGAESAALA